MTDQMIPADAIRAWRDKYRGCTGNNALEALDALLPAPALPTLADMTDEERAECQWMQADVKGYESRVVIVNPYWEDGLARVMWLHTRMNPVPWKSVTPRPDLPRLEWPGDECPEPEEGDTDD